jgi:hypothetical protein
VLLTEAAPFHCDNDDVAMQCLHGILVHASVWMKPGHDAAIPGGRGQLGAAAVHLGAVRSVALHSSRAASISTAESASSSCNRRAELVALGGKYFTAASRAARATATAPAAIEMRPLANADGAVPRASADPSGQAESAAQVSWSDRPPSHGRAGRSCRRWAGYKARWALDGTRKAVMPREPDRIAARIPQRCVP